MPVTHWTPSYGWAGSSLLDGVRGIANPLTGPFSEPTILLAKHHHMFLVPLPFLGLLALTGIGFSWCLLWLLATSCFYAWNREDSWREELGADAAGALPPYPQQATALQTPMARLHPELRTLEAAVAEYPRLDASGVGRLWILLESARLQKDWVLMAPMKPCVLTHSTLAPSLCFLASLSYSLTAGSSSQLSY